MASSSSRRSIKSVRHAGVLQDLRDVLIPRAVSAAAAAMSEQNDGARLMRQPKRTT